MTTITGNLLDIRAGTVLHQVNCLGVVGGLAGALDRKWPRAFIAYRRRCVKRERALGSFVLAEAWSTGLYIGHVFGQLNPGPNTDIEAVKRSLDDAAKLAVGTVYAPYKMGCGLGGGEWEEYLAALIQAFPDIVIVQRPQEAP